VSEEHAVADSAIRVIFICTGNSARSQMAETVLRNEGGDAFEVHSAGTHPKGVHPLTVRVLTSVGYDVLGARSKELSEFVGQPFDYVVTVCDRARESCPVFPGATQTLHWGFDDPAEADGTEEERLAVFERVLGEISMRIRTFTPIALRRRGQGTSTVVA
jgi:arsenate reductase (thioredoxin)